MADDAPHEDVIMQSEASFIESPPEISSQDVVLYKKLRVRFFMRLQQWYKDGKSLHKERPSLKDQNSLQLLDRHIAFQDNFSKYVEYCQKDPDGCDVLEPGSAYPWPDPSSNDTVDGEILSNLMFVSECLRSTCQQYHAVLNPDRRVSRDELRKMISECLYRYVQVSMASFDIIPSEIEDLSQDQSDLHRSHFTSKIPHLYLPQKSILSNWYASIETEHQTCICRLNTDTSNILLGSMLVIVMSKRRTIHVRVTDVQEFAQLDQVSDKEMQHHAFQGTMSEFQQELQKGLSQMYTQEVTAQSPIHVIYFTVCSADAHVYERAQPACESAITMLDEIQTLQHNQLPCIQQEKVVSLVNMLHEIQRSYVSIAEKQALMDKYHAKLGTQLQLVSCASCGIRGLESDNEYGFVQMHLLAGFPFLNQFEDEEASTLPAFQYKRYPIQPDASVRSTALKNHQIEAMCKRLLVDTDLAPFITALQEHDHAEENAGSHLCDYFNSLSRHQQVTPADRKSRGEQLKAIRDSIEKPEWTLSPEQLHRYQAEQCIRSRHWDHKTARYYWLHPELVQAGLGTEVHFDLCSTCRHHLTQAQTNKEPADWYSLCNKKDFGNLERIKKLPPPGQFERIPASIPNLPQLTVIEQMIVQKVRILIATCKFTIRTTRGQGQTRIPGHVGHGNQVTYLKGQCIATENIDTEITVGPDPSTSSDQAAEGSDDVQDTTSIPWTMLAAENIANRVNVYFMVQGKVGQPRKDRLAELMIKSEALTVRREHILRHLYFHQRNTPGYQQQTLFEQLENEAQWQDYTSHLHTHMKKNMHIENDDSIREKEAEMISDITGGHTGMDVTMQEPTVHVDNTVDDERQRESATAMRDDNGVAPVAAQPAVGMDISSTFLEARQVRCTIAHDVTLTGSVSHDDDYMGRYLRTDRRIADQPVWVHESFEYMLAFHALEDGGIWTVKCIDIKADKFEIETLGLISVRLLLDGALPWREMHAADVCYDKCTTQCNTTIRIEYAAQTADQASHACLAWSQFLQARDRLQIEANIPSGTHSTVPVILNDVHLTDAQTCHDGEDANKNYYGRIAHYIEEKGKLDTANVPYDGDSMSTSSDSDCNDASMQNDVSTRDPSTNVTQCDESVCMQQDQHADASGPRTAQSPLPSLKPATIRVLSSNELMNSKYETDKILYGGFPYLFPLAKGLEQHKSGLPRSLLKHFVSHFTTAFANNSHFLFYVFNCHVRTLNNTAAYVALKDRQDAPSFFERYISDPSFLQKARNAANNPNSRDAQEVSRIVNPYLQITGAQMPFSDAEKKRFSNETWAMFYRFGEPDYFFTFSPNGNSLSLRFSYPTVDPRMFPATNKVDGSRDFRALFEREGTFEFPGPSSHVSWEVPLDIDLSAFKLAQFASAHPVGCVEMFKRILDSIIEILIGLPPMTSRKSMFKSQGTTSEIPEDKLRSKGIFGYARAMAGCAECSGRDSVHCHGIVWNDLTPMRIQLAASNPLLMKEIAKVIESHVFAHIPVEYHVQDLLNKMTPFEKRTKMMRFGAYNAPDIHSAQSAPKDATCASTESTMSSDFKKHLFTFATSRQVCVSFCTGSTRTCHT